MFVLQRRLRRAVPALAVAALALGSAPAAVAATSAQQPTAATGVASNAHITTVLVTGSAAAVGQAKRLVSHAGFENLPVIGGFSARVTPAERARLVALGLTVTDDAPVKVADADWGEDSHDASAVYPQADGAPSAWAKHIDGKGVGVAVIDTGINATGDLAGKVIDGYDFSGEGKYTTDSFGHGTFVAGTIAGSGDASDGAIKGVAPGANLISLKIAGADGSTDVLRVVAAVQWAVNHADKDNIRVINLSLGTDSTQDWRIDPLDAAVEGAWRAGLVVTVSAGNGGSAGIAKPADDPFVITVGASDDGTTPGTGDDTIAPFSSTGPTRAGIAKPDLVAPGDHLVSTRSSGSTVDKQYPGSRVAPIYFRGSGTSFSAPQVAGAAALLLQQRPELTNDYVKGMLVRTATALPGVPSTAQGSGELNIPALLAASPGKPANAGLKYSAGSGSLWASQGSSVLAGPPAGGDDAVWHAAPWTGAWWGNHYWNHAAWNTTGWNTTGWNTTGWNTTGWNTTGWNTTGWNTTGWNTTGWNTTGWNTTGWNTTGWNTTGWNTTGWNTTGWNTTGWN